MLSGARVRCINLGPRRLSWVYFLVYGGREVGATKEGGFLRVVRVVWGRGVGVPVVIDYTATFMIPRSIQ